MLTLSALLLIAPGSSYAAGIIGGLDKGDTDLELYTGIDGLSIDEADPTLFGGFMVGYGLSDRVSAYVGNTLHGDSFLLRGHRALRMGVVSKVLDGPGLDLNLRFELREDRTRVTPVEPAPGFEFNLDLGSQFRPWGLYFRGDMPLPGDQRENGEGVRTLPLFELTPGVYFALDDEGNELYFEYVLLAQLPRSGSSSFLADLGLAIGYSLPVDDDLELTSEISAIPAYGGPGTGFGFGAMVGLVVRLPGSGDGLRH